MSHLLIPITESAQVGEARRAVTKMAQSLGFDETTTGRAALVATELGTNLVSHAKEGRMLIQPAESFGTTSLEMITIDSGPGVANMQRCLQDGYSTAGTPGNGLGAIKRQSTTFDFYSVEGRGTVVLSRVSPPRTARHLPPYHWGAISLNAPYETVCGDTWGVSEKGAELAIMVADGLGHGPLANEAAARAKKTFEAEPFVELAVAVERSHRALLGSRGAAIALAVLSPTELRYAGVGNIAGAIISSERRAGLLTQNGTIGVALRKVQEVRQPWPGRAILVMHSDGLTSRWSLDSYPGLALRHPSVIAGVLSRDFLRGKDDATVLVVSGHPQVNQNA